MISKALQIKINGQCSKKRKMGFVLRKSLVTEKLRKKENPKFQMKQGWTRVQIKSSVFIELTVVNPMKGRV